MASYSVVFPTWCYAQDYNAIVITDSDAETYGAEETLAVAKDGVVVFTATYNGWVDGKTLTIETSGILRALADTEGTTVVSMAISGVTALATKVTVLNGSAIELGSADFEHCKPLRRYWWSEDLALDATIVSGCTLKYGTYIGGLTPVGTIEHTDYSDSSLNLALWTVGEEYSFRSEYVGIYADNNGIYRAFEVLRWEDYHQGEMPVYVRWRDNYGIMRSWVFSLVGESASVSDGVEYMGDNDGYDRINGYYRSITIRESLADRDTRQYLLSLAHSSQIYVTTSGFADRHAVPADEEMSLDLSVATADYDITLKIYRTEV